MTRPPLRAHRAALTLALLALAAPVLAAPPAQLAPPQLTPSKGDIVPVFETTRIDGQPQKVDFPKGSKTVLLFFMSSCPHCHKMIPDWNRAYERRAEGLNVVGVIMDQEPPSFWSTMSVAFPVVRAPGRQFLRNLNVNRVPLTLRVTEGGAVEDLAQGVIDPIRLGELFKP